MANIVNNVPKMFVTLIYKYFVLLKSINVINTCIKFTTYIYLSDRYLSTLKLENFIKFETLL